MKRLRGIGANAEEFGLWRPRTLLDGWWGAIGGTHKQWQDTDRRKIRVEEGRTGPLAITESGEAEGFH